MPGRDLYHQTVVDALVADGWTITDDPLRLAYGGLDVYIDLGAEQAPIGAERDGQKIAVEIKSFVGASLLHDMEVSVGQYNVYRDILSATEPDRLLYLAIAERVYSGIFSDSFGQLILRRQQLRLLVFSEEQARIVAWIAAETC